MTSPTLAFIGGGNMGSALIGGLLRAGLPRDNVFVIEPHAPQRDRLAQTLGVKTHDGATAQLMSAHVVIWAVKPQSFAQAAYDCHGFVAGALHLSVMAGVRSEAIVKATGARRVVRAMPNTPATIGRGIAGLYARPEVEAHERGFAERLLAPSGQVLWVDEEEQLDAVTAISASGPAYVFYFIEAMIEAAAEMGLSPAQGRTLAQATFEGAAALAAQSELGVAELRAMVTSRGGTTHAAISVLEEQQVKAAFVRALHAARQRAAELGRTA